MNVYDLQPDGREERQWVLFYTKHKLAMPRLYKDCAAFFDAHPRIAVDRNTDSTPRGSSAKLADYSDLSHDRHPVFSDRAKQIFAPHLQGLGRWIELEYDEAPYWLFFVTHIVDALNEEKSEILRFSDGKRVMRIASYAFKPEAVANQFLFTLPQQPGGDRLVTDAFIDLVRQHRLTGFWFQRLWCSDTGPEPSGVKDWLKPRITGLEPQTV
jgi:hypothetical protein